MLKLSREDEDSFSFLPGDSSIIKKPLSNSLVPLPLMPSRVVGSKVISISPDSPQHNAPEQEPNSGILTE